MSGPSSASRTPRRLKPRPSDQHRDFADVHATTQLITSLTGLSNAAMDVCRAVMNFTGGTSVEGQLSGNAVLQALTANTGAGAIAQAAAAGAAAAVVAVEEGDGKKKRKRKPIDPNAPKKPLTAFFLFSQHARQAVRDELGPSATGKEISNEIGERWQNMDEQAKEQWKAFYDKNFRKYLEEKAEYLRTKGIDDNAADAALQGAIGADDGADSDDENEAAAETAVSPPAPTTKAKGKPGPKKKSILPPAPAAGAAAAAAAAAAAEATPGKSTPAKEKKGGKRGPKPKATKKGEAAATPSAATEEPTSGRKRKRKNDD